MKSELIVAILRWVVVNDVLPNMKGTWIHADTLAATIRHHYIILPSHKFNGNDIKIAFGDKVLVDMFGFQPFQNSILNVCGLAMATARIAGSRNCAIYLFPHEVMKIRVRGDEASADNTRVRKSRRQSAGSGSTNYCDIIGRGPFLPVCKKLCAPGARAQT